MTIRFLCLLLLIGSGYSVKAQFLTQRAILHLDFPKEKTDPPAPSHAIPLTEIQPFLSFFLVWEGQADHFSVRFSEDGITWSDWERIRRDVHSTEQNVTELFITKADYRFFQIQSPKKEVSKVFAHFFSPGNTPQPYLPAKNGQQLQLQNCEFPSIINRQQWCPNGNCPRRSGPQFTEVSHLIVHHSAGTNNANDWAAIVRAIYDLHVVGNGWADIGYNYLVDPNGVVYEGRGEDVLGAHFCARNSNTMGVCVMGNFQNQAPTEDAVNSLVNLLSWKAFKENIDPVGRSLHPSSGLNLSHISGHREGCNTACPGDQFFPLLQTIKGSVRDSIELCSSVTSTDAPFLLRDISISPNPVSAHLQLRGATPSTAPILIDLLGASGQVLKTLTYAPPESPFSFEIDVSELPRGIYFLRVFQKQSFASLRFVKHSVK
jgi:hypothetical protein